MNNQHSNAAVAALISSDHRQAVATLPERQTLADCLRSGKRVMAIDSWCSPTEGYYYVSVRFTDHTQGSGWIGPAMWHQVIEDELRYQCANGAVL